MTTNHTNAHEKDEKLNPNQHTRDVSKHIALYLNAQERTHNELVILLRDALAEYNHSYWSTYFNRTTEIKALETALQEGVFSKKPESTKSVSAIVLEIIHNEKWKNDGFNAELIRVILKQLGNYDKSIKFKDDNICDVLSLLANDIAIRKENDKKIGDQQEKLNQLETRLFAVNNELLLKKKALTEATLSLIQTNKQIEDNIEAIKVNNQLLATQKQALLTLEEEKIAKTNDMRNELDSLEKEKTATLALIQTNLATLHELEIQQKKIDEEIVAADHRLATILPGVDFAKLFDPQTVTPEIIDLATKNATIEFKSTMMAGKEKQARMNELQQVKENAAMDLRSARKFSPNQFEQCKESGQDAATEADQAPVKTRQQVEVEAELATLKNQSPVEKANPKFMENLKAALTGQLSLIQKALKENKEKQATWEEALKNKEHQKDREEALITTGSHTKILGGLKNLNLNIQDEFDHAPSQAPKEKPQYKSFKVKTADANGTIAKYGAKLNLTFAQPKPEQTPASTPTAAPAVKMNA